MKASYTVKSDGKWYHKGDEIPSPDTAKSQKDTEYTKNKIMFMKTADLRELALKEGVNEEFANSANSTELRKKLMEHFGL